MSFSFLGSAATSTAASSTATTSAGGIFSFGSKPATVTTTTTTAASGGFSFNLQPGSSLFAAASQASKPASTTSSSTGGLFQSIVSTPATSVSTTTSKLSLPANYTLGGSDGKSKEQRPMDVPVPGDTKNAIEAFTKFLDEQKNIRAECAAMLMSDLENSTASLSRLNAGLLKSKEKLNQLASECADTKESFYKVLTASRVIGKETNCRGGVSADYYNSLQAVLTQTVNENEKRIERTCDALGRLEKHLQFGTDENLLVQDIARAIRNVHRKLAYVSALSTATDD